MKNKTIFVSALVGVLAIVGCVSVEGTRAQLNSNVSSEVKKAEDTIFTIATTGKDPSGFSQFQTSQRVEYVQLTSNQDLLLRIIDTTDDDDSKIIEAATERLDFSRKGVAHSFIQTRFHRLLFMLNEKLRKLIISNLTQDELIGLIKYENNRFEKKDRAKDYNFHDWTYHDVYLGLLSDQLVKVADSPDILWKMLNSKQLKLSDEAQRHLLSRLDNSPDILWKMLNSEQLGLSNSVRDEAQKRLLSMLDKVQDNKMIVELLSRDRLIEDADKRIQLVKKLPDDQIVNVTLDLVNSYNKYGDNWPHNREKLNQAIEFASYTKDEKNMLKILIAILNKIETIRKERTGRFFGDWDSRDDKVASKLIQSFPKVSDAAYGVLACLDGMGWKHFINKITPDVAYRILIHGKAKSEELETELANLLSADKVDMKVYDATRCDAAKKAVLTKMSAEMKKQIAEKNIKAFAVVEEKAKVAAKDTFELHGFYLGMTWEDMKTVLSHHFPDLEIKEMRDGKSDDADYIIDLPDQRSPFCYASANDRKVYQFNFGKKILKKWYQYDVQTFREWARAYSRENKIDMKYKEIEKEATVTEPMDWSRSYRVWFHQESYQYKHNTKEYRLTYFGEEKDFTVHGGLGGAVIKEAAAPQFRYVRGDPGSLRARIEND